MILSVDEQLKLIETIRDEVGNLGDYLYPDKDPYVNAAIDRIETALNLLKNGYNSPNIYITLRDRETGEIEKRFFRDVNELCYAAAQFYAWRDCDDTYDIENIIWLGAEIEYVGWQEGMLFEFRDAQTRKIVYSNAFPQWDH